jgi:hypothetical protein
MAGSKPRLLKSRRLSRQHCTAIDESLLPSARKVARYVIVPSALRKRVKRQLLAQVKITHYMRARYVLGADKDLVSDAKVDAMDVSCCKVTGGMIDLEVSSGSFENSAPPHECANRWEAVVKQQESSQHRAGKSPAKAPTGDSSPSCAHPFADEATFSQRDMPECEPDSEPDTQPPGVASCQFHSQRLCRETQPDSEPEIESPPPRQHTVMSELEAICEAPGLSRELVESVHIMSSKMDVTDGIDNLCHHQAESLMCFLNELEQHLCRTCQVAQDSVRSVSPDKVLQRAREAGAVVSQALLHIEDVGDKQMVGGEAWRQMVAELSAATMQVSTERFGIDLGAASSSTSSSQGERSMPSSLHQPLRHCMQNVVANIMQSLEKHAEQALTYVSSCHGTDASAPEFIGCREALEACPVIHELLQIAMKDAATAAAEKLLTALEQALVSAWNSSVTDDDSPLVLHELRSHLASQISLLSEPVLRQYRDIWLPAEIQAMGFTKRQREAVDVRHQAMRHAAFVADRALAAYHRLVRQLRHGRDI